MEWCGGGARPREARAEWRGSRVMGREGSRERSGGSQEGEKRQGREGSREQNSGGQAAAWGSSRGVERWG